MVLPYMLYEKSTEAMPCGQSRPSYVNPKCLLYLPDVSA